MQSINTICENLQNNAKGSLSHTIKSLHLYANLLLFATFAINIMLQIKMILSHFFVSVRYACFLFSCMTDCTYLILLAFVRVCKTSTNDDALEMVTNFDNHAGLFATCLSSTLSEFVLFMLFVIEVLDEIYFKIAKIVWRGAKAPQPSKRKGVTLLPKIFMVRRIKRN